MKKEVIIKVLYIKDINTRYKINQDCKMFLNKIIRDLDFDRYVNSIHWHIWGYFTFFIDRDNKSKYYVFNKKHEILDFVKNNYSFNKNNKFDWFSWYYFCIKEESTISSCIQYLKNNYNKQIDIAIKNATNKYYKQIENLKKQKI